MSEKIFTSNIKVLMKRKKLTIRELIAVSGLANSTISKARSDSGIGECRLSTLKRIAAPLGVKTKDLYEEN